MVLILLPAASGVLANCGSQDGCCEEESSISSEEPQEDNCISVCLCSCCGATVVYNVKQSILSSPQNITIPNNTFIYQSPIIVILPTDIWHPPQLS